MMSRLCGPILVVVLLVGACTVSDDAQCRSDDDCAAEQRCVKGGGIFVRDAVCVDRAITDVEVGTDVGVSDVGAPDTDADTDIDVGDAEVGPQCPAENEQMCAGSCVDVTTDVDHCGECGHECHTEADAEPMCDAGQCSFSCVDDALDACLEFDVCVDLETDEDHCGECGHACGDDGPCVGGVCELRQCNEEAQPFGYGDGSEELPYAICAREHLENIDDPEYLDAHFALRADLDLGEDPMEPIARGQWDEEDESWQETFDGVFDGNGHAIENLFIDIEQDRVGLFGVVGQDATITDLALESVDVHTSELNDHVGALAGINRGSIRNVTVTGEVGGGEHVGLMVGRSSGAIADVQAFGTVSGQWEVGGVVGSVDGDVDAAAADVDVVAYERRAGGLVGQLDGGVIRDSEASGDVAAGGEEESSNSAGGLVGRIREGGEVIDSIATGAATGGNYVGGLVGISRGTVEGSMATGSASGATSVGGLIGSQAEEWTELRDSSAVGVDVEGTEEVGGLLGTNRGSVEASAVESAIVDGDVHVGGLVGLNHAAIAESETTDVTVGAVQNNGGGLVGSNFSTGTISESVARAEVEAQEQAGGLAGRSSGTIEDSYAEATVRGGENVGGLVGLVRPFQNAPTVVRRSRAAGEVDGEFNVGGLVGEVQGDVRQSYATATVGFGEGANNVVGGLVGNLREGGTVTDSHADGDVTGQAIVGGLVGVMSTPETTLATSYAMGLVDGTGEIGGLVGQNNSASVQDSYWNRTTSGTGQSDGGEPIDDEDFDDEESFSGFDFEDVWQMSSDRPLLQWQSE